MSEGTRIVGRVLHRGAPQAGCRVVAGDERARAVVADAETGPDGRWELALPAGPADVVIVARCTGEALGVVTAPVPADGAPLDLEITSVAPTHEVTVRLEGQSMPDWVQPQVRLTPLQIGPLDGRVLRWIQAPVRQRSTSTLARIVPQGREFRRDLQAGTWWITAEYFEERGVRALDQPPPQSWVVSSARTADGGPLEPLKSGFQLPVDGPLTVTLELSQAPSP